MQGKECAEEVAMEGMEVAEEVVEVDVNSEQCYEHQFCAVDLHWAAASSIPPSFAPATGTCATGASSCCESFYRQRVVKRLYILQSAYNHVQKRCATCRDVIDVQGSYHEEGETTKTLQVCLSWCVQAGSIDIGHIPLPPPSSRNVTRLPPGVATALPPA